MTTVYFVRHAQSDGSVLDARTRPLTPKGQKDCALVTAYLRDKQIQAVFSSPYQRAVDTVRPFVQEQKLPVETVEAFREHETVGDTYADQVHFHFIQQYWNDLTFKLPGDESIADLQKRNIDALEKILREHAGESVVVGTHGMALASILRYYDGVFGFADFLDMVKRKLWIVKLVFDGSQTPAISYVDLFA